MTCQNLQNKLLNITVLFIWYFFSNTRQNGEWTETITRQDEKELAMFGE
jgi:hypothetical protein